MKILLPVLSVVRSEHTVHEFSPIFVFSNGRRLPLSLFCYRWKDVFDPSTRISYRRVPRSLRFGSIAIHTGLDFHRFSSSAIVVRREQNWHFHPLGSVQCPILRVRMVRFLFHPISVVLSSLSFSSIDCLGCGGTGREAIRHRTWSIS